MTLLQWLSKDLYPFLMTDFSIYDAGGTARPASTGPRTSSTVGQLRGVEGLPPHDQAAGGHAGREEAEVATFWANQVTIVEASMAATGAAAALCLPVGQQGVHAARPRISSADHLAHARKGSELDLHDPRVACPTRHAHRVDKCLTLSRAACCPRSIGRGLPIHTGHACRHACV